MADEFNDLEFHLAEFFHENTKISTYKLRNRKAIEINSNPLILQLTSLPPKEYRTSLHIKLPPVRQKTSAALRMPLEEAIYLRRSIRKFSNRSLSINKISKLLYLSNAVLKVGGDRTNKIHYRAAPSSGGLCSIEIYPIVLNVKGLEQGIYHYDSLNHRLDFIRKGDFKEHIKKKLLFQKEFGDAAAILILASWFSKLKFKYGDRGYRYGFLDAGHIGAHIYLISTALDLACCGTCGFIDDEVNSLIGLNGLDESAVYLLVLGEKA